MKTNNSSMVETKRLPDEKVSILLIECKNCKSPVMACVSHSIDKDAKKEISELVVEGHSSRTIPLLEYREIDNGWCDTRCNQ